ncbi:DUF6924 domain-containing protein [Streptomyces lonegramiae]|uniref:DUF6924 domain-containing protein n=1 Tax=Streptomyces lonegramiae TaxID=3075524 RepID=A0ABU2XI09_9ACTN|nr:hypothetical protein [Streptomyces sp. DSM 41529]MDT0544528.1 hypothetical protein [Streptomyces sp. DSM 41529]
MLIETELTPLLRTDFHDDAAWQAARAAVAAPVGGGLVRADTEAVDDRRLAGLTSEQIVASIAPDAPYSVVVVADRWTMAEADMPLLVIALRDGAELRCVPEALWALLTDTGVRGMGLAEFLDDVGPDGLFRGTGGPRGLERRLAVLAELRGAAAAHQGAPHRPEIPGLSTATTAPGRPASPAFRAVPSAPAQPLRPPTTD